MNSSQLHLPSLEKGQLNYYGFNYPNSGEKQGGSQQPQYAVPPGSAGNAQQAQVHHFYPASAVQQQKSTSQAVASSVTDLAGQQNPSQQQFHFQPPFVQLPHAPQQTRKRPWWMWAIGVVDIVAALLFTAEVVHNVVTKDRFIPDRDTLMWTFFLLFLSLCVQLFMGLGLLVGLKSEQDGTTFWYCQTWICGAYFLFGETSVLLLTNLLRLQSGGTDIGAKLLIVVVKTVFRIVSFVLVRRFMNDLRGKSQYRLSATEIEQFQQQRMQQIQQLQQFHEERLQRQHQQQQQRYLQEQSNNEGTGRRGARGSECLYYAPQMSMLMSMMINQDDAPAVPT